VRIALPLFAAACVLSTGTHALAGVLFDRIGSPSNLPSSGPEGYFRYGSQIFPGEP
jgi:hypothetical protein